jgi:hypothetical protein
MELLDLHCSFKTQSIANCSFQNDRYLALSIDSSYNGARDCYRIAISDDQKSFELIVSEQIVSGGTENLALAVSQQHWAVILLNTKGSLFLF